MGTHRGADCPRSERIAAVFGVTGTPAAPEVAYGRTWTRGGVVGRELSWNVDDGPRAEAWYLRPAGVHVDIPAVLLMHAHDGVKFYGKDKVADGPDGASPGVGELRGRGYDGLCVADALVAAGFAVLVHDVHPWGSRRVPWSAMPARAAAAGWSAVPAAHDSDADRRRRYDAAAREHEHGLAKIAALTGTSLAGRALHEDLLALEVLRRLDGVDERRIGVTGFSCGGARVCHVMACAEPGLLAGGVVTASMSTFADIADGYADDTSWSMITPGLAAVCEWPDVVASAAPTPLLVQFAELDGHFGVAGMQASEAALQTAYAGSGGLATLWYAEPHRFSASMQSDAVSWLVVHVASGALDRGL